MKKFLFMLIMSLVSLSYTAQFKEVNVQISEKLKLKNHYFKKVVHTDNGYFYTVGSDDKKINKTKAGADFRLTKYRVDGFEVVEKWDVPSFEYKGLKTYYMDSYYNKTGYHLIVGAYDGKNEKSYVLHRKIGPEGSEEVRELFTMYAEDDDSRRVYLITSKDEGSYLIFNEGSADQQDGSSMALFDQNFNKIWGKTLGNVLSERDGFVPDEIKVTNDQRVYMLGENTMVSRVDGKMKINKELILISYDGKSTFLENNFSADGDYRFTQLSLFPDVDDQLIIVGFLSKMNENYILGNFFLKIDQKGQEEGELQMNLFDQEWLDRLPGGPKDESLGSWVKLNRALSGLEEVRKGLRAVEFRDLVAWGDGFTAVADRRYNQTSSGYYTPNGMYYTGSTSYFFEDLLVVNFDKSGKMTSRKHIPREFYINAGFETYGNYYLIEGEDEVYVLFNDKKGNAENYEEGSQVKEMGVFGLGVNYARVDRSGKASYGVVSTHKEEKAFLYPSQNLEVGTGEGLNVYIKGKKAVKFARFKF